MLVKVNGEPFFRVTSDFQAQDTALRSAPHTGIDLAMYEGTPLPSVSDGKVIAIYKDGVHGGIGNGIKVQNADGTEVIYGHLSKVDVEVGDKVHIGEIIGKSGNTGNSSGPHLHLAAKENGQFVNPSDFIETMQELGHKVLDEGWSTVINFIHFGGLF